MVPLLLSGATRVRHLQLLKSEPANEAHLTESPSEVHLWYNQAPQVKLTSVKLTSPDGNVLELKPVTAVAGDTKHLAVQVPAPLGAGAYTVAWRTLARDGHAVNGKIAFQIDVTQ
jgi:methionine-rich copper-binding protein CopC